MLYRDNAHVGKKNRVPSTRKQVPETSAHKCTLVNPRIYQKRVIALIRGSRLLNQICYVCL